jgi:hypothetical protein
MKIYELDVRVHGRSILDWFYRKELVQGNIIVGHEVVFSISGKEEMLEDMGYYLTPGGYFKLPAENLIILGLKHTGLLNCSGVQGYYLKTWDEYECIVTVKIELLADKDYEIINENSIVSYVEFEYSKRERNIRDRIRKFFNPIAIVENCDQGEQSVGYGD